MLSPIDVSYPVLGPGALAGTQKRIGLVVATTVGIFILIAAATLFWHAYQDRHAIVHRGLSASVSAARALEREVDAMGYLLKGLSRSPLLRSGDLEGFYNQLQATPRPEGAWFTLWDHDRVLLRTRDPFGAALPRVDELAGVRDRLEVVRAKGLSMSDRMHSPVAGQWVVSVSLRLNDASGQMDRVLSLLVPEEHLNKAAQDADDAAGWATILLDRKLHPIATGMDGRSVSMADVVRAVSGQTDHGHFESGHGQEASLVAFQRSPTTGYTILAVAPAAMADAPIRTAFHHTLLASLILLVIGSTSAMALLRNVGPVDSLRLSALATRAELLAANARLGELLESMSDCHFTLDDSCRVTSTNASTLRWCGRSRGEIIGRSYLDLVAHNGDCVAAMTKAVKHRMPFHAEIRSGLRPDRIIDLRVFPSPEGARVYFSDVTDRVAAHRAIVEERELLQSSLDALTEQIVILDEHGRILAVNRAWRRFVEDTSTPAHSMGARYLDIAVPGGQRFSAMEDVIAGSRPSFQALYQTSFAAGDRWFTIRAFRFRIGDAARILVSHEDVTELMTARASVSELSERLLTLQDEERQRIASELHDSTTQYLVAVGLNLMKVEPLLPQRDGQRLLGEIDHLLEEALKELRLFTYLLHPAGLEENGFAETIQAFGEGFSDRTGIAVACRIDSGVGALPLDLRRALLRIVQEALANVHRHADATRVVVKLRQTSGEVILCIADDGHGMQAKPAASRAGKPTLGVGIPGMRIRLHQFGGTLRIRTGRTGTVVRARVPREPQSLVTHGH